MKLPEISQFEFQGSTQTSAFDPLKLPDPTPGIQAQLATIGRSFQNLETSGKEKYAAMELQAKQAQQLYDFIPKAASQVFNITNEYRDHQAKKWAAGMAVTGYTDQDLKNLMTEEMHRPQIENGEDATNLSSELRREGQPFSFTNKISGSVGLRDVYLKRELAKRAGYILPDWVNETRKNNTAVVNIPGLGERRLNDQTLDEKEDAAIREWILREGLGIDEISGPNNVPIDILMTYTAPQMKQQLQQQNMRYARSWRATTGENNVQDAKRALYHIYTDPNLAPEKKAALVQYQLRRIAEQPPANGDDTQRGMTESLDTLEQVFVSTAGTEQAIPLKVLLNTPLNKEGETYAQRFPLRVPLVTAQYQKAKIAITNQTRTEQQQALFQKAAAYVTKLTNEPGTASQADVTDWLRTHKLEAARLGLSDQASGASAVVAAAERFTVSGVALTAQREEAEDLISVGRGSTSLAYFQTDIGRASPLYAIAKQQEAAKMTPGHEKLRKGVNQILAGETKTALNVHGDLQGAALQGIGDHAYARAEDLYNDLMAQPGADEEQVRATVLAKLGGEFVEELKTGSGKLYEKDSNGRFTTWTNTMLQGKSISDINDRLEPVKAAVTKLSSKYSGPGGVPRAGVFALIQTQPALFASAEQADSSYRALLDGRGDPYYSILTRAINEAAGTRIFNNSMELNFAIARAYNPGLNQAAIQKTVEQSRNLTGFNKRFAEQYMNGQSVNPDSVFLTPRTPLRVASAIEPAVGKPISVNQQQRAYANSIYEMAKRAGARHPEVAAAIASFETGWGKTVGGNNPFNMKRPGGGFMDYATVEDSVKEFVRLWDKNHGRYKNLESFDDPNEAFAAIVSAYAPASDNNPVQSYKQFVADFIKSKAYLLGP